MTTWQVAAAAVLSLGWLLPNHSAPWTTFHADALLACVLFVLTVASWSKFKAPQPWSYLAILLACLCTVPILQLSFGLVKFAGTGWTGSAYLLGFLLAVLTGARWESVKPNALLDILFLAIGLAASVSVGLQLCQWVKLNDGCLCNEQWVNMPPTVSRFSANMGQPNQLATLLIWGVLAYGWAWHRRVLSANVATLGAIFLLFGLALTDSRTGVLELCMLVVCSWVWRGLWQTSVLPKLMICLAVIYFAFLWLLPTFSAALLLDYTSTVAARTHSESRLDIWAMFIDALFIRPWFGYGWDQGVYAQVLPTTEFLKNFVGKGIFFAQSHNLFLDLMVWLGIPLGLGLSAALLYWLASALATVKASDSVIPMLLVLTAAVHAMLELPLHHAYFLLPFGLVVGVLDVKLKARKIFTTGLTTAVPMFILAGVLLGLIIRDYFAVEESFNELRLERARIVTTIPRPPPEVVLLTQLRDFIILARTEPSFPTTPEKLQWIENTALIYPIPHHMVKLAAAFALNGQAAEAQVWMSRICIVSTPEGCTFAKSYWAGLQEKFDALKSVPWPKE